MLFKLDEIAKWAEEYKRNSSFKKVAEKFGVSTYSVYKYLRKYQKELEIAFKYIERRELEESGLKKCRICSFVKELSEFKKGRLICTKCINKRKREESATSEGKRKRKNYKEKNKEKIRARKKKYREENKEKILKKEKEYREKNKENISIKRRKNQQKRTKYERDKRNNDINYKISSNLRRRLYGAIKNNQKTGSAIRDLGCSIKELKQYLEKQFYPHPKTGKQMTWGNWTLKGWHIDHIKPLASFDLSDREQLLEALNYTNLQPLWSEDNLSKGTKI